jgi:hypothetical protein
MNINFKNSNQFFASFWSLWKSKKYKLGVSVSTDWFILLVSFIVVVVGLVSYSSYSLKLSKSQAEISVEEGSKLDPKRVFNEEKLAAIIDFYQEKISSQNRDSDFLIPDPTK